MKMFVLPCALLLAVGIAALPTSAQKKDNDASLRKGAKISMEQAEKTALGKEPGTIKSEELEKEKGKLIYSFDIQTKSGIHEVNVDAITGKVVEDSVESKADEAKEKQQDAKHHHSKKTETPPTTHQ